MPKESLKQLVASEYARCAKDPVHFMRRYCYIQHPTRGKMLFNLYDFQCDTLNDLNEHEYNIILKSRQLGISTLCAGYSLWAMLFNQDFNVLVIATKQDVAKNLVTKVRVMHDYLPTWLKGKSVEDNKLSLRFANGSQIKAVSAAGDAGRSEALSLLVIDEAAFIDKIDDIWASAQQTLATGGRAVVLSTPNGIGNFFHKNWVKAKSKENSFHPIELHWTVHPERDQDWRDEQDAILGPDHAAQECDCDFISSGHTVIPGDLLQLYKETTCQEPVEQRGLDGGLWIWEYPDYSKSYLVSADVARGDGNDYSAFHIFDIDSLTQVAEFKGQIGTKEYGNMLVNIATEYNEALLVIENANIGWAAIQPAIDRNYNNLYYTYKTDGYVDAATQLSKGYDLKEKAQMTPGFTTSQRTRPLLISKLDIYFRERELVVKSTRLIDELFTFIWKGQKAEAQGGYNDDLVMSFAIGLFIRDSALKLRNEGIELNKRAINYMGKGPTTGIQDNADKWKWNPNGKGDSDLTWLLK
jgi:hypothetical protein